MLIPSGNIPQSMYRVISGQQLDFIDPISPVNGLFLGAGHNDIEVYPEYLERLKRLLKNELD